MPNVLIDKDKLDVLANAISNKSGEALTLTLDEMVDAVDGIETGGGGITPTGNIDITQAGVTDVTNYATVTVPSYQDVEGGYENEFYTLNNNRRWRIRYVDDGIGGWVNGGYSPHNYEEYTAIPNGTSITPTESSQTIGGSRVMMQGAVTVNAIPSNYVGSGITQRTSSDLTANGNTVTAPSGYYGSNATKTIASANWGGATETITKDLEDESWIYSKTYPNFVSGYQATAVETTFMLDLEDKSVVPSANQQVITPTDNGCYLNSVTVSAMPSGTEGTPTATKGTVTNHSVTVTPNVTNTAGYISGGSHSGTAVSVSASELVSGSQTVTENDTYDVTNLATLVVNVSGGGSGSVAVGTKTATLSASASSISFTGLSGNPTSFVVTSSADQSTGGTKVVAVAWDGTSFHGMDVTTQAEADTGFTKSYSSGTLTITATTASFQANEYKLVYTYGGSSSDIHTADVQVGSGATSITFSSLSGRPIYYSCVFKSSFSTSSGYQRVIDVVNDGTNTYGHAFDSSAKAQTSWTSSYSGGSLTITSSGTNNGGYFHQPGYYQLTYAVDDSAPQYETVSKTYRASTTAQSETIQPSSGYDAIEQVSVSIPAVSQTNLTAANIKSGTTITISNGQSNLWSVTGSYTGGGGDKNVQISQSTTRNNASSLTKANGDLTVSKTGTYDIYWTASRSNTSTSYTWGSRLYVDGEGYGTENTSWSNNVQNNHLSNVSLTANQKLSVYTRGRSGSYYTYAPMLLIIES